VVWLVECFNNRTLVLDLFADRMRDKCARAIFIKVDLTVASCCT
jgi:hypothetical protein